MNTPRKGEIRRYDRQRHPKNQDLPNRAAFEAGVKDAEITALLGELVANWPHVEEAMVYVFAALTGAGWHGSGREIFRSIITQDVKIRMMRFLLEETEANASQPAFFDKAISEFESLNKGRNKYIHGLWYSHEGKTYLSTTDPARHPFETKSRKIQAAELREFLNRAERLKAAVISYQLLCDPQMPQTDWPAPMKEHLEQLRQGIF